MQKVLVTFLFLLTSFRTFATQATSSVEKTDLNSLQIEALKVYNSYTSVADLAKFWKNHSPQSDWKDIDQTLKDTGKPLPKVSLRNGEFNIINQGLVTRFKVTDAHKAIMNISGTEVNLTDCKSFKGCVAEISALVKTKSTSTSIFQRLFVPEAQAIFGIDDASAAFMAVAVGLFGMSVRDFLYDKELADATKKLDGAMDQCQNLQTSTSASGDKPSTNPAGELAMQTKMNQLKANFCGNSFKSFTAHLSLAALTGVNGTFEHACGVSKNLENCYRDLLTKNVPGTLNMIQQSTADIKLWTDVTYDAATPASLPGGAK